MDKPEQGKTYALTGGSDEPSISKGNTWAESEVKPPWNAKDILKKARVKRCTCGHLFSSHDFVREVKFHIGACVLCPCRRYSDEGESNE